jgi:hypothetical protein
METLREKQLRENKERRERLRDRRNERILERQGETLRERLQRERELRIENKRNPDAVLPDPPQIEPLAEMQSFIEKVVNSKIQEQVAVVGLPQITSTKTELPSTPFAPRPQRNPRDQEPLSQTTEGANLNVRLIGLYITNQDPPGTLLDFEFNAPFSPSWLYIRNGSIFFDSSSVEEPDDAVTDPDTWDAPGLLYPRIIIPIAIGEPSMQIGGIIYPVL